MIVIVLPDLANEQQLLANAKVKDQEALRMIYESYFPPIYQFIRLRINEREQARDIAADVFVDFFMAIRSNRAPHTSLRAWLFRVARNKVYDHYGKQKQFPMDTLEDWVPASSEHEPEFEFLRSIQVEHVRRAMNMLVAEQQEVLILRFGQGLSLQETADLMDKSTSAIKSLQFRSVETLRKILDAGEAG